MYPLQINRLNLRYYLKGILMFMSVFFENVLFILNNIHSASYNIESTFFFMELDGSPMYTLVHSK